MLLGTQFLQCCRRIGLFYPAGAHCVCYFVYVEGSPTQGRMCLPSTLFLTTQKTGNPVEWGVPSTPDTLGRTWTEESGRERSERLWNTVCLLQDTE